MARTSTGSYSDRLVASNLSICILTCASPAASVNLLGSVRDNTRRSTVREIDVGSVMDTLELVKAGRKRVEVDIEVATESSPVARVFVGHEVAFTHDISGKSEALTGLLLDNEERLGGVDGAQTETFKIVCTIEPS